MDSHLYEQFAEKDYDQTVAPLVEDKFVLNEYEKSVKNNENRYEIGLPLKDKNVTLPNNYSSALNRLIKPERRFKSKPTLKNEYIKFMGKLFEDDHAIELE